MPAVFTDALDRHENEATRNHSESQVLISIKQLRKIRKFPKPAQTPPAAAPAPVRSQAEEWGGDSPAGRIRALASKERPERRLPPPAAAEIRRPVASPAQIRRPGGAPYASHGGAICVPFFRSLCDLSFSLRA